MKLIKYYVGKIFLIAFLLNVQMSASSVSGPSSRSVFSIPHSTTHSPKSNLTANSTIPSGNQFSKSTLFYYSIYIQVIQLSSATLHHSCIGYNVLIDLLNWVLWQCTGHLGRLL